MMRDITHSDGVLPPWDWLMACSLNAESKETNWRRKWTRDGSSPATLKPVLLFFSSCPLFSNANLILWSISSTVVDLKRDRRRQTYTRLNVIKARKGRRVLFHCQRSPGWWRALKGFPHRGCHVPDANVHTVNGWWTADVNWVSTPNVKSCSSTSYVIILFAICTPLS